MSKRKSLLALLSCYLGLFISDHVVTLLMLMATYCSET